MKAACLFLSIVTAYAAVVFAVSEDTILYNINWPGQNLIFKESSTAKYDEENSVVVSTNNNEKYRCMIPSARPDDERKDGDERIISPLTLLSPLLRKKSCAYRLEAYWTYEICHGKHIRQYHEEKAAGGKINLQEFYLGYFNEEPDESGIFSTLDEPDKPDDVTTKKIDGNPTPYFTVGMKNGTPCPLKGGAKRVTRVLYVCHPDSRNEISSITETSSCEYEMIILTPLLCSNPYYKVKGSPVNEVYCQPLDDSPRKPKALVDEELEMEKHNSIFNPGLKSRSSEDLKDVEPTKDDYRRVEDPGLSKQTDKALLREFLSGDFCLKGGSGWWNYEFCYGKHVVQYHDDRLLGRTVITVGVWNEDTHLKWAKKNKPRLYSEVVDETTNKKKVRLVQHFYDGGNFCDEVKKPRQVIVKLKCKRSSSPHAVTIYLLEPSTCSYILGIESPIICDLLDSADENGLFVSET